MDFGSLASDTVTGNAVTDTGTASCGNESAVKTEAGAAPPANNRIFCLYDVEKLDGCGLKSAVSTVRSSFSVGKRFQLAATMQQKD
jgi:hypothetical protein